MREFPKPTHTGPTAVVMSASSKIDKGPLAVPPTKSAKETEPALRKGGARATQTALLLRGA